MAGGFDAKKACEVIDYADAKERFGGNEALFRKLAGKYAEDPHYKNLVQALACDNAQTAYQEAHALKGVAGNLSFSALYEAAAKASDALREGDAQTARALLPELREAREAVLAALEGF